MISRRRLSPGSNSLEAELLLPLLPLLLLLLLPLVTAPKQVKVEESFEVKSDCGCCNVC